MTDVREVLSREHHAEAQAAPRQGADAPVDIRLARPGDADGLARCFYRAYGDSYDHDWVYRPDELRRRWARRMTVSVVGTSPEGDVIGHIAADLEHPTASVGESGQAVVDPRYRGHHLFESMKRFLATWAHQDGLYGLFSEATAVHPYSQRGNLALGAHEMGFLIGYIPSGTDYKAITEAASAHRATAALMYLRTNEEPERVVHVPGAYRGIAMRIYHEAGLRRVAGSGEGSRPVSRSELHVRRDAAHNAAQLHCKDAGSDIHAMVARHLEALRADGVDCVYLDLPLADPDVFVHAAELDGLGFAFSCILPEIRPDGDVLRLQHLNGVDAYIDGIATASDFGRGLLGEIAAGLAA